jgi:hypothetical protein
MNKLYSAFEKAGLAWQDGFETNGWKLPRFNDSRSTRSRFTKMYKYC